MNSLEVTFAGVKLRNPLILASATPSWDGERANLGWKAGAGAVIPKSFAPPTKWAQHPRCGRMRLVKHGKNRIGMVNIELYTTMTLKDWLDTELDKACEGDGVIIASIVAHPDPKDTGRNAKLIEETGQVAMFEINVSCPMPADSSKVGFQMGNDPEMCYRQVQALKKAVRLPVGIKLTPTTHNMVPMAQASEKAGADFVTIGNSIRSFAGVDIKTGLPKLPAYGGYSGPAIKPVTQRHVSEVAKAVNIPISACGGISTWEDVVEYMMLGATTVQTCTSIMWHGYAYFQILLKGLSNYLKREKLDSFDAIRGKALPHIVPIDELSKRPVMVAKVKPLKCINLTKGGCGLCGKVCFYGAIRFAPKLRLDRERCDGCGLCTEICPTEALKLVSK
ncbi:MAG: tRNA-dihydrouridine synthase [Thermodesulfobacteriota bacterium]|nr:tRNA-dihydrouridine synthase [Thermodesulfobacteriota bacterium]